MEIPEIYLDAAATTPPLANVLRRMEQVQRDAWANPSSLHSPGLIAAEALGRSRTKQEKQKKNKNNRTKKRKNKN